MNIAIAPQRLMLSISQSTRRSWERGYVFGHSLPIVSDRLANIYRGMLSVSR